MEVVSGDANDTLTADTSTSTSVDRAGASEEWPFKLTTVIMRTINATGEERSWGLVPDMGIGSYVGIEKVVLSEDGPQGEKCS